MPFNTEAVVFDVLTAKIVGLAVEVGLPHENHRVSTEDAGRTRDTRQNAVAAVSEEPWVVL